MHEESEIRFGRHCAFHMHVHLVFVTKYRRGVFTKAILDDLRGMFVGICALWSSSFRRKLWRRPYRDHPPVHRAAADTALKSKDGYAVRAILPRPEGRGLSRYQVSSLREISASLSVFGRFLS